MQIIALQGSNSKCKRQASTVVDKIFGTKWNFCLLFWFFSFSCFHYPLLPPKQGWLASLSWAISNERCIRGERGSFIKIAKFDVFLNIFVQDWRLKRSCPQSSNQKGVSNNKRWKIEWKEEGRNWFWSVDRIQLPPNPNGLFLTKVLFLGFNIMHL